MKLKIHRGANEIGGSCVELTTGDGRLVLDLGMPLVKPGNHKERFDFRRYRELSGQELVNRGVLPDIDGLYSWDSQVQPVSGLVISHAHQDHYGFMSFVRPDVPVYASVGTRKLVEISVMFLPDIASMPSVLELPKWKATQIGPFAVTGYLVDHSAPDALALVVEADGKRLMYSGDLRAHGRKGKLFESMVSNPPENIDCLLLEGTMMDRGTQKFADEDEVVSELVRMLSKDKNPMFVFCSSQNIDRICSVYKAAIRSGRHLVIDLYTAFILDRLRILSNRLPQHELDNVRVKYWCSHADTLADSGYKQFLYDVNRSKIEVDELAADPGRFIILARANNPFKILADRMPDPSGIDLVWSQWYGYLTGMDPVSRFSDEHHLPVHHVHTSGHATVSDLQRLVSAMKPARVVPIHTFSPEQYQAVFANVTMVPDGGELEI